MWFGLLLVLYTFIAVLDIDEADAVEVVNTETTVKSAKIAAVVRPLQEQPILSKSTMTPGKPVESSQFLSYLPVAVTSSDFPATKELQRPKSVTPKKSPITTIVCFASMSTEFFAFFALESLS